MNFLFWNATDAVSLITDFHDLFFVVFMLSVYFSVSFYLASWRVLV